jgi:glycerol dehydrogenase-like iron-containing ADH family enzyme
MKSKLRQHPPIVNPSSCLDGCTCGREHPAPRVSLYSGEDVCQILAKDCLASCGNRPVLLLSDPETDVVVGRQLREALQQAGVPLEHYLLESNPVATDHLVETIEPVCHDKVLIISVGSGTVNDLGKKVVSDIDWQCESLLASDSYCGLPARMMAAVEKSYSEYPEAIGRGDDVAVMGLFNGLLLSGVAMSLAGSSAPASGEHLLSHFLDMREPVNGRVPELHGLQVGVGIILSTACYRRLVQLPKADLSHRAEQVFSATAARIPEIWGPYADEVAGQFNNKRAALLHFDTLLPQHWHQLQSLFRQVRSPEYFAELFARTGAPFHLEAFRLTKEEFLLAAIHSRAIRDRITVLDLAAHAQVLESAAEDALELLR